MLVLDIDRKHIENKYHGENFNPFNRFAYHGYDFDESTGLSDEEIKNGVAVLAKSLEGEDHAIAKSKMFEYVLQNTRIDVNGHDYFVGIYIFYNSSVRSKLLVRYRINFVVIFIIQYIKHFHTSYFSIYKDGDIRILYAYLYLSKIICLQSNRARDRCFC